jgi:glutathione S-transferase
MNRKTDPPPPIEFGYWKIKLKAHYIRYLMNYVGLEYTEWNPRDVTSWRRRKDKLFKLNPLVTIPFYKEGDLVVSKPGAIAMAICMRAGRKDLIGNTPQKLVMVRTLQSSLSILMNFLQNQTLRQGDDVKNGWRRDCKYIVEPEL